MPLSIPLTRPSTPWLAEVFDNQYDALLAYAYRRAGDTAAAQEVAAAVFNGLVRHLHAGRGLEPPVEAWLFTLAARQVARYALQAADPVARVQQAIASLTATERQVIELCHFAELPPAIVALHMATSAAHVAERLHRARKRLQPPDLLDLRPAPPPAPDARARLRAAILTRYEQPPATRAHTLSLGYTAVQSPLGLLYAACTEQGIAYVTWTCPDETSFALQVHSRYAGAELQQDNRLRPRVQAALQAYDERRAIEGIDLSRLTPFEQKVLQACSSIQPGQVRPYGWIARQIGNPGAVRAVGTALARNPVPLLVPCHRVVAAGGRLGNYSGGGPEMKAQLLQAEGINLADLPALLQAHD